MNGAIEFEIAAEADSPDLAGVAIPIELRDEQLAVVRTGLTTDSMQDVPPGTYLVLGRLPTDEEMRGVVTVAPGGVATAKLSRVGQRRAATNTRTARNTARATEEGAVSFAAAPEEFTDRIPPVSIPLRGRARLFIGDPLTLRATPLSAREWSHDVVSGAPLHLPFTMEAGDTTLTQLIEEEGQPGVNVRLPVAPGSPCEVIITRKPPAEESAKGPALTIDVQLANAAANAVLGYQQFGRMTEAASILQAPALKPERLLLSEHPDPMAAMVSAYALLRLNDQPGLEDWTAYLCDTWRALPDAATIRGEHLARQGQHEDALAAFLQLGTRGLPLFADGFSYALDRLALYLRSDRLTLESRARESARSLHHLLSRYGDALDRTALLMRFTGDNPDTPRPRRTAAAGVATGPQSTADDDTALMFSFDESGTASIAPLPGIDITSIAHELRAPINFALNASDAERLPHWLMMPSRFEPAGRNPLYAGTLGGLTQAMPAMGTFDIFNASGFIPTDSRLNEPEAVAARVERILSHPLVRDAGRREATLLTAGRIIGAGRMQAAWLELGVYAARTVGRLELWPGRYANGTLVSPRLLLTTHGALRDPDIARNASIDFSFQLGLDGRTPRPHTFALRPDECFVTDPALDYTLVAVAEHARGGSGHLSNIGYNRLSAGPGKILTGEPFTIVHHPNGGPKEVAFQDQVLTSIHDNELRYVSRIATSCGAPLFNDQWEMIGVRRDPALTPGAPEQTAVRISRILSSAEKIFANLTGTARRLLADMLAPIGDATDAMPPTTASPGASADAPRTLTVTVPLRIEVALDRAGRVITVTTPSTPERAELPAATSPESFDPATSDAPIVDFATGPATEPAPTAAPALLTIDRNYTNRTGFESGFLGGRAPLPEVRVWPAQTPPGLRKALSYRHFTIALDTHRRIAVAASYNFDLANTTPDTADTSLWLDDGRTWVVDPRVPAESQMPSSHFFAESGRYRQLVPRAHIAWTLDPGSSLGGADAHHLTNAIPDPFLPNTRPLHNWLAIPEQLARLAGQRAVVFTGPILTQSDPIVKDVPLPLGFWQIVVVRRRTDQAISASAYVLETVQRTAGAALRGECWANVFAISIGEVMNLVDVDFSNLTPFETARPPQRIAVTSVEDLEP